MSKKGGTNPEEIVKHLKKVWPEYRITVQQIKNPNTEFLLNYLELFFESIKQDPDVVMNQVQLDVDVYGSLISVLVYCNMLKSLFNEFDVEVPVVNAISPGMFLLPTTKFAIQLLNITLSYLHYYLLNVKLFDEDELDIKKLSMKQEELTELDNNLKEEKNALALRKTECEKNVAEVKLNYEVMLAQLEEIKKDKVELKNTCESLETQFSNLCKEVESLEIKNHEMKNKLSVVDNYFEKKNKVKTVENEMKILNEDNENLKNSLKTKNSIEQELNEVLESCVFRSDNLLQNYKGREEEEINVKKLKCEIDEMKTTLDYTSQRIKERELEIAQLEESHSKVKDVQHDELNKKEELIRQVEELEDKVNSLEEKYSASKAMQAKIYEEIVKHEDRRQHFDEYMKDTYDEVINAFDEKNDYFVKIATTTYNKLKEINKRIKIC